MGNENCVQVYENIQQNQAYGEYQLIKQNNKTIASVSKSIQCYQQLKHEVLGKLQLRLKLKSPHLVKLIKYDFDPNMKFSTLSIKMYYEFIGKTLQDKIKETYNQKQEFTERELFNIIYGVENALNQLNKYDIRHGCINLTTILCQNNFYKITDVSSTTFVKSYDLVRRGYRNQFLSQKLLTNLQYRSLEPFYQLDDDLFSLGMIVLMICEKKTDTKYFYSWQEKNGTASLKWKVIQIAIKNIERNYSSKLSKKVKSLIHYEVQQKSLQTNFTINNLNVQHVSSINEQISELDRDIEKILSRVQESSVKLNFP